MLIRLVFARSTSVDILAFSLSVGFLESLGMHIHFFMISKTFPFLQCAGHATGVVNGCPLQLWSLWSVICGVNNNKLVHDTHFIFIPLLFST
jgi:hypothetical protein